MPLQGFVRALEQALENKESFAVAPPGARVISPGAVWRFSCVGESDLVDQGSESEEKEAIFSWRAKPVERSAD